MGKIRHPEEKQQGEENYLGKKTKGYGGEGVSGRGRKRGHLARRQDQRTPSSGGRKCGRKMLTHKVQEAGRAYSKETNVDIRRIIQELEASAMQEDSDPEMEDWGNLISDPGNTRSRLSLYKKGLHVYQVLKRLLAKAMEQVAMESVEMAEGIPNSKKEMKNLQITLLMQDSKLEAIQQHLQKIVPVPKEEDNLPANMVD